MISNKRILGIYLGVLVALIYGVMSGERKGLDFTNKYYKLNFLVQSAFGFKFSTQT